LLTFEHCRISYGWISDEMVVKKGDALMILGMIATSLDGQYLKLTIGAIEHGLIRGGTMIGALGRPRDMVQVQLYEPPFKYCAHYDSFAPGVIALMGWRLPYNDYVIMWKG
jgi:hypothetical protein